MHYYEQNIGDYRKDTGHLTLLEHGIYRSLLDTYYLDEKPLTLDHAKLMRSHSVRSADEMQAFENVLQDFFVRTENGYTHKRCDTVIKAYHDKAEKARQSAKARWSKEKTGDYANAMRSHSEGNANHKPLTNNQEPIKTKEKAARVPRFDAQAHLVSLGVDPKVSEDWLALRKKKNLAATETAFAGVQSEAAKAGMSLDAALRYCCTRGWGGFDASWMDKAQKQGPPNNIRSYHDERRETIEALTGRNRKNEHDERIIDIEPVARLAG